MNRRHLLNQPGFFGWLIIYGEDFDLDSNPLLLNVNDSPTGVLKVLGVKGILRVVASGSSK